MMRNHPEMSEKWIQHLIAEDPSILGLGDWFSALRSEFMRRQDASTFYCKTPIPIAAMKSSCS